MPSAAMPTKTGARQTRLSGICTLRRSGSNTARANIAVRGTTMSWLQRSSCTGCMLALVAAMKRSPAAAAARCSTARTGDSATSRLTNSLTAPKIRSLHENDEFELRLLPIEDDNLRSVGCTDVCQEGLWLEAARAHWRIEYLSEVYVSCLLTLIRRAVSRAAAAASEAAMRTTLRTTVPA